MYHHNIVWIFTVLQYFGSLYVNAEAKLDASDDECYCLVKRLSDLRNPVHISSTTLNGANIYLITEQIGVIREYNPASDTKLSTYLDLRHLVVSDHVHSEERGLLGVALHPDFENNHVLYTYSIRRLEEQGEEEYAMVSEITDKDLDHEKLLLLIEQPGSKRNGGQLLFADDGFLYVFVGDGEPDNSTDQTDAQNAQKLLGKILRLDVSKLSVQNNQRLFYSIPDDNPKMAGWRPEIYAMGIRNVWRCGVDRGDSTDSAEKGRIFCGDLGGAIADEMNIISKGGNYGWHYREGNTCLNITACGGNTTIENEQRPIYTFNKSSGVQALVGGPVYRGKRFSRMGGRIVVGDFTDGELFTLKETSTASGSTWSASNFTLCPSTRCGCDARDTPPSHLLSFGDTHDGEVFVLMTDDVIPSKTSGALLELVPPHGSTPVTCGAPAIFTTYGMIGVIIYLIKSLAL